MGTTRFTESSEVMTARQRPPVRTHSDATGSYRAAFGQPRDEAAPDGNIGSVLASCHRTALVVAGLCEELRADRPKAEELEAMVWASHRVIEWVSAASRHAREASVLRYLAEAACANMALRGLAYEYFSVGPRRHRLNGMVLAQSRKVGAFLGWAAELYGRNRARRMGRSC